MAAKDMDRPLSVKDSVIDVNESLEFNDLWEGALQTNASLLQAGPKHRIGSVGL